MGYIEKSKFKGLNLPDHFDPSMAKMRENMEIIDSLLNKAVPDFTSFGDDPITYDLDVLSESGTYILSSEDSPLGEPTIVRVYASPSDNAYREGMYLVQEVLSMGTGIKIYRIGYQTKASHIDWDDWRLEWNSLMDGEYSGLDADLLDGLDKERFLCNYDLRNSETPTDFNYLEEPGIYYIKSHLNAPDNHREWLCTVLPTGGIYAWESMCCIQIAVPDSDSDRIYTRKGYPGGWTAWQRLMTTSDIIDARTLEGKRSNYFVPKESLGFDVIVESTEQWNNLLNHPQWKYYNRIGIACDIDSMLTDIVVPDNVTFIGSIDNSFDSFTQTPTMGKFSIFCNNLKGHKGCTIKGLDIKLRYDGGLLPDDYTDPLMSDFGVVDNCKISIGNIYSNGNVSLTFSGLYNCDNVYHTLVTDADIYISDVTKRKNLTYVAECQNLVDVKVDSFIDAYDRSSCYMFYNCDSLTGCSFKFTTHSDVSCSIKSGFYKCSNLTNCSATIDSGSMYFEGMDFYFPISEACDRINGLALENLSESAYHLMISDCPQLIHYSNKSGDLVIPFIVYCNSPYIPVLEGGSSSEPLSISSIWAINPTKAPYMVKEGFLTVDSPFGVSESIDTSKTPVLVLSYNHVQDDDLSRAYGDIILIEESGAYLKHFEMTSESSTIQWSSSLQDKDMLVKLLAVDGSGSNLDADMVDGVHASSFAGTSPNVFTSEFDLPNKSGVYMLETKNIEGSSYSYGVTKSYYSSTSYALIAVSIQSGKVFRKTSSQTSWNEITPRIPVVSNDPSNPSEGQMWILVE